MYKAGQYHALEVLGLVKIANLPGFMTRRIARGGLDAAHEMAMKLPAKAPSSTGTDIVGKTLQLAPAAPKTLARLGKEYKTYPQVPGGIL